MSGTPGNDEWQGLENSLCTHRLFSLHGDYEKACLRWLETTVEKRDEVYPRCLMLDSGAFTAWNKGHKTSLDEVKRSYGRFMKDVRDLFDEIWMINLDVIPGTHGRDPTSDEVEQAIDESDKNFPRLVEEFGPCVLPVYHQGEDEARLAEVEAQAEYICVSPRNDLHEQLRVNWSARSHASLKPETRTHGLATTGNKMLADVPWYSVDSAAWVLHGGYGLLDIFNGSRYQNIVIATDGNLVKYTDVETGESEMLAGKMAKDGLHFATLPKPTQEFIVSRVEEYGLTLEQVQTSGRLRGIVCMGEIDRYVKFAAGAKSKATAQDTLFGI